MPKNNMATGVEREKFEETLSFYKSVVWKHFGFAVEYVQGKKTVNRLLSASIA